MYGIDDPQYTAEFHGASPEDLHSIYGVNCYQYALGYPHILISGAMAYPQNGHDVSVLGYIALIPGERQDTKPFSNVSDLRANVLKGCKEDGVIDIGTAFEQRSGYRTAALYFRDSWNGLMGVYADFHFARVHPDGNSSSKIAFGSVKQHKGIQKFIGDYELDRFVLIPENAQNAYIAGRAGTTVHETFNGKSVSFRLIHDAGAVGGNNILSVEDVNVAINLSNKFRIPMPTLPAFRTDYKNAITPAAPSMAAAQLLP
ncbi:MAG TPA: hypothetical protein VIN59_07475 [Alphaproteobacteria bacterium]